MKNLLKSIITTVLVAAITITGISVDITTVTAATTKGGEFQNGGTITIKPGDELKLTVTDTTGEFKDSYKTDCDISYNYRWSSSDASVLLVETDMYDEEESYAECVVLIGVSAGTATVTGKCKNRLHPDISMTVNVTLPKATAKQKKCKHKYKITKKATCERAGIKTCKKCKFQKSIKKLEHEYVTRKVSVIEYDYFTKTIWCTSESGCSFACTIKYDKYGYVTPDSEYPSFDAALDAMDDHFISTAGKDTPMHGTWGDTAGIKPYGKGHEVIKSIKKCKYCNKEKEPMESQAVQVDKIIQERAEQSNQ